MKRLPPWLVKKLPSNNREWHETQEILQKTSLNTVCHHARCPNCSECFSKKTATFLILGDHCSRNCAFCHITHKTPLPADPTEPQRVADAVQKLGLNHVVITMVTRDDLLDGGAAHMAKTMQAIKKKTSCSLEVLTSDFQGNTQNLDIVLEQKPEIFNHNIETVLSLSKKIRPQADYHRSLHVLEYAKNSNRALFIKSGLMVGLGEQLEEIQQALKDLKKCGCDIVTIGQYLRPSPKNIAIHRYITPQEFQEYENYGLSIGLKKVYSGPYIRSSYN
ncbi:MAG: lipoyl synthase, partial [Parachlamydiales bacterium]|nr:lipoyl synthase [Parachlamydiales bacterium]